MEFFDRMLTQLRKPPKDRMVKPGSGLAGGCSEDLHSTPEDQVATVYAPDGEMIAAYNTSGGGWQVLNTQAENLGFFWIQTAFISKPAMPPAQK